MRFIILGSAKVSWLKVLLGVWKGCSALLDGTSEDMMMCVGVGNVSEICCLTAGLRRQQRDCHKRCLAVLCGLHGGTAISWCVLWAGHAAGRSGCVQSGKLGSAPKHCPLLTASRKLRYALSEVRFTWLPKNSCNISLSYISWENLLSLPLIPWCLLHSLTLQVLFLNPFTNYMTTWND